MKAIVFDIEADGLLVDAKKVWCVATKVLGSTEAHLFTPNEIEEAYKYLLTADRLIAHNGVMYDVPVLERLVGEPSGHRGLPPCIDTLLISRILYPDRQDNPIKGHGLADWGWFLGVHKLDFHDWSHYSQEMGVYCQQDVVVNEKIYEYQHPKAQEIKAAITLDHRVARIIVKQILNGFVLSSERVHNLQRDLTLAQVGISSQIKEMVPDTLEEKKVPEYWRTPDGNHWKTKKEAQEHGYKPKEIDRGPNRVDSIPFNPGSTQQVAELLKERYGWKPKKLTDSGRPAVDEKVLKSLSYPEAKLIYEYKLLQKRLSQTDEWVTNQAPSGRVHGNVIVTGTVTGRMSHSTPNMAQIPKVGKPWGKECRACFGPRPTWTQVGADASGLEFRMLAHYVYPWDRGFTVDLILNGDIHSTNQEVIGLDSRDTTKTFWYAYCYGAGDAKLGAIAGGSKALGAKLRSRLETHSPIPMGKLKKWIEFQVKKNGYLIGLDGRHLPVRSNHMALNTLLQSAGALVMKQALIFHHEALEPHGERWAYLANVHDEFQCEAHPSYAPTVGETAVDSIKRSGEYFKLKCPLDGEYKIGGDWSETH